MGRVRSGVMQSVYASLKPTCHCYVAMGAQCELTLNYSKEAGYLTFCMKISKLQNTVRAK